MAFRDWGCSARLLVPCRARRGCRIPTFSGRKRRSQATAAEHPIEPLGQGAVHRAVPGADQRLHGAPPWTTSSSSRWSATGTRTRRRFRPLMGFINSPPLVKDMMDWQWHHVDHSDMAIRYDMFLRRTDAGPAAGGRRNVSATRGLRDRGGAVAGHRNAFA